MQQQEIKTYLTEQYPELKELFNKTATTEQLKAAPEDIPRAMVSVVVNQMLSRKAADTILARVKAKAKEAALPLWELDFETYRACGLSKTKASTIIAFSRYFQLHKKKVLLWHTLSEEELIEEITALKGLGNWSANILAMFYLGKENIFPEKDATLMKTKTKLEERFAFELNIEKASPYKSYLAMYMWRFEDGGLLE